MTAGLAAGFGALMMVVLLWSLVVWYFRRYWKRVAAENYPNERAGYSAAEAKQAGYSAAEVKQAGFYRF